MNIDENSRAVTKPPGFRGLPMEGGKLASEATNKRRALRDIRNLVGAPLYPCAISKRGELPDKKNAVDKKNITAIPAHRPITRRFAATLKSQSSSQDSNPTRSNSNGLDDCTAIDVDDYNKLLNDYPFPMVEETENAVNCVLKEIEMEDLVNEDAIQDVDCIDHKALKVVDYVDEIYRQTEDKCELKEIEMEDLNDEDPIQDIDCCDQKNPLAVVDYVDELYSFYRQTEASGCVSPKYMSNQFDINEKMRAILIDWLIEVHYKFELMDETLFLTVNIIDRFLARQSVVRKKLQLVGVTAMLLACKYEEVSVPVVEDLILISDRAYTREEVLQMEKLILNTLQFNISVPTPYVFMRRFLKAAQSDKKMELLTSFLIELCLVQYEMLKFQPSLLAAAAVYTAKCTLKGFSHWSKTTEIYTCYVEEQLIECSRMMVDFHRRAGVGKLTGVHRKYSTFKFGFAAKSEPALFLLSM